VTRAGATTILELAALAKPTILIPNGKLTGGHQLKNARVYSDAHAVNIVDEGTLEQQPGVLVEALRDVLGDGAKRAQLSINLAAFARPEAARDMADMIIDAVR